MDMKEKMLEVLSEIVLVNSVAKISDTDSDVAKSLDKVANKAAALIHHSNGEVYCCAIEVGDEIYVHAAEWDNVINRNYLTFATEQEFEEYLRDNAFGVIYQGKGYRTENMFGYVDLKDCHIFRYADAYIEALEKLTEEMQETLQTLQDDCEMALNGEWDKSDDGFEAMIYLIDKIIS